MSLTVLLLNFPDETASILESVLVGATDIKNLSPVPLSSAVVVIRCRWFKRTAQHGKVEDSVWASFDPQISRSDQIRSETEEWRRQSRRVSTLWSSLCVRHSFGVFWVRCQGYQGLNWLNHVQSTQLFWKCSKLSYVV